MFKPILMRVNRKLLIGCARERTVEDDGGLVLSWGADSDAGIKQSAYNVTLVAGGREVYATGWTSADAQECLVPSGVCPRVERVDWTLIVKDEAGRESERASEYFYIGNVDWTAEWIRAGGDMAGKTLYFRREFTINKPVRRAALYACGLGYHRLTINGARLDDARLDPAHTDYTRVCQYVMWPEVQALLKNGANCLGAMVGGGWRDNPGAYARRESMHFAGDRQLSAMLDIAYKDGTTERLVTDACWQVGPGANTRSHLFDGEDYDANETREGWELNGFEGFPSAAIADAPGGDMRLMTVQPIYETAAYSPIAISRPAPGLAIIDFGYNIAGVVRLKLKGLQKGQRIRVRHAEILGDDGLLCTAPLRSAKATDTYTASGDARDLAVWQPEFTYHGFRYASVEGYDVDYDDIEAVLMHTDMRSKSCFRCGSDAINALQAQIVLTERDNMHSILTDCPQRDERMGWMNDATVRFEETPYNFECAPMFRKLVRDLISIQRGDGAIACTAPKVYGSYPADPVCSSFLIAAFEAYMHFGDIETVREGYPAFRAWEACLLANSKDYIVNYSYYGDWAGPAYACEGEDGAKSIVTPGIFMSTGYSYYNCRLLAQMASVLDKPEDAREYAALADKIESAMLGKWYDAERAAFATGSMACQAFALWLKIVPEADRQRAARKMRDELVNADYAFTTGNLCTKYLVDMLAEYGYIDDAYALLTRDKYPSWGYMRQMEATTVWERFEHKENPGMNSRNHPMYGAVGAFLYEGLAGVAPLDPGYARFRVRPRVPKKLMSAQARVQTPRGYICARWVKSYGAIRLFVDVPFGCVCETEFMGEKRVWTRGAHSLAVPLDEG